MVNLEKLDDSARKLWGDFQRYLANEREKIINQIENSILKSSISGHSEKNLSRIVNSEFSTTPLSCKGSYISPPGGRFNFGQSISYKTYFPALYVSSSFEVAFYEKFQLEENTKVGELSGLDLSLRKPDSFSYLRINLFLDKIVDLRQMDVINAFYEVIKDIKMPEFYKKQAKKLKISMDIIKSSSFMKEAILQINYQQWDYWIDCPSPSQWFGHYARLAGIQGIIYPSVRYKSGFNIAIFPDQFENSSSYVELSDQLDHVDINQRKLDSKNFNIFL